jgi:hypothetical protein
MHKKTNPLSAEWCICEISYNTQVLWSNILMVMEIHWKTLGYTFSLLKCIVCWLCDHSLCSSAVHLFIIISSLPAWILPSRQGAKILKQSIFYIICACIRSCWKAVPPFLCEKQSHILVSTKLHSFNSTFSDFYVKCHM